MLAKIVIANPTQVDLVLWATLFHGVMMTVVIHVKDGLYHNKFLMHIFSP
jgi:hypothetical protein